MLSTGETSLDHAEHASTTDCFKSKKCTVFMRSTYIEVLIQH